MAIYGVLLPMPGSRVTQFDGYPVIVLLPIILLGALSALRGAGPYLLYFVVVVGLFHLQFAEVKVLQLGGLNVMAYDFFTFFSTLLLIGRMRYLRSWKQNRIYRAFRLFALVTLFGIGMGFLQFGPRAVADARLMPLMMLPAFLLLTVLAEDRLYFYRFMKWLLLVVIAAAGQILLKAVWGIAIRDDFAAGSQWVRFSDAQTSMFIGMVLVMLVYYYTFKLADPMLRRTTLLILLLLASAFILAQTRTAWVSVAAVMPIAFLYAGGKVRPGRAIRLSASLIVVLLILFTTIKWFNPRVYDSLLLSLNFVRMLQDPTYTINNVAWRFLAWNQVWSEAVHRPILGYGWGKLTEYYTLNGAFEQLPVHNSYLELFYKQGAVGVFFFMLLILRALRQLIRMRKTTQQWLTIGLFLVIAAHSIFNFAFGVSYWFFIALALAVYQTHQWQQLGMETRSQASSD